MPKGDIQTRTKSKLRKLANNLNEGLCFFEKAETINRPLCLRHIGSVSRYALTGSTRIFQAFTELSAIQFPCTEGRVSWPGLSCHLRG